MAARRSGNRISKNPRVQRFAAMDLKAAFKKYYPKPKETRRALTRKQFNTICYMLGATDYTVLEIAERVSRLGEKISRRPVEKINKILKVRTSEEAKTIGKKSVKRKLSSLNDEGILALLTKKGTYGVGQDFVHSQSDVVEISGAGRLRVNRLAQQARTRADNLRVSKRREWEKRRWYNVRMIGERLKEEGLLYVFPEGLDSQKLGIEALKRTYTRQGRKRFPDLSSTKINGNTRIHGSALEIMIRAIREEDELHFPKLE